MQRNVRKKKKSATERLMKINNRIMVNSIVKKSVRITGLLIKVLMLLLGAPLLTIFFMKALPWIYTPPALTEYRLVVFSEAVRLVEKYPEKMEDTTVFSRPEIAKNDENFPYYGDKEAERRIRDYYGDELLEELKAFRIKLFKVRCNRMLCRQGFIYFFTQATHFLPDRPGVAYSLVGADPNDYILSPKNQLHVFVNLIGNWYMSRLLYVRNVRHNNSPIPYSIFDFSQQLPISLKNHRLENPDNLSLFIISTPWGRCGT